MKVLLVEDEDELAQALAAALRREHCAVDAAGTLQQAELLALGASHDVIVLDRGLPDGDGLALLGTLRRAGVQVPVLVLTAMNAVPQRVQSLDLGADDHLAKPFAVDELMARLRALARRPAVRCQAVLTLGGLQLALDTREVQVQGRPLPLPRRQLLVLEALLQRRGRTVQRAALIERVYGDDEAIRSNALDSHVSRLRAALEAAGAQVEIHSIRGVGYLLRGLPAA